MAIADAGTSLQLLPSDKPSVTRRPAHADMSVVSDKPQHRIEASVLSQTFWIDPAYKIKKDSVKAHMDVWLRLYTLLLAKALR